MFVFYIKVFLIFSKGEKRDLLSGEKVYIYDIFFLFFSFLRICVIMYFRIVIKIFWCRKLVLLIVGWLVGIVLGRGDEGKGVFLVTY